MLSSRNLKKKPFQFSRFFFTPLTITIFLAFLLWGGVWIFLHKKKEKESSPLSFSLKVMDRMKEKGVPHFTLPDLNNKNFSLNQIKGKLVLINFWASWCKPCIKEFPSLLKLTQHFKGKLVLIAISIDKKKEEIAPFLKSFMKSLQTPFVKVLWDPEAKVASLYGFRAIPESYIISPQKKLIRKVLGVEDWYTSQSLDFFSSLMKVNNLK